MVTPELRHQIVELEGMLQKEKVEFEVSPSIIHGPLSSFSWLEDTCRVFFLSLHIHVDGPETILSQSSSFFITLVIHPQAPLM